MVLYELDPTRPLPAQRRPIAARPYASRVTALAPCLPEDHLWGPRGYYKDPFYTDGSTALFVSEIGYHGMSEPAVVWRR